ncbi:MAG: hypothetical protein ACK5C3_09985 [bacterium]
MKINGNSSFNPMLFAQSQKGRMPSADASAMQRAIEQAGEGQGPNGIMMAGNSQPPVDANTILENWGTSNAIADLNVDGIVDAQDLAMVLHAAQDAPAGGGDDSPGDEWSSLVGGDLNGDGTIDAIDLAMKLNAESPENGGGGNDSPGDEWSSLVGGDLNGDGTIDAMDLAMKLNAESPENGGGSNDSPADDPTSPSIGMVDAAELIGAIGAMPPDTSPADMLERLTNLIFKAFDTDGDGVLTEANLPDNTKVFARFDADGSGALHRNELLKGLTEEYQRALETSDQIAPGPFAKRWLETFSGLLPIPAYTSPMQLQELYSAPKPSGAASLTPNILSAQA